MRKRTLNPYTTETIAMFLKFVYEATKKQMTNISLSKIAEKYKMPYSHVIPSIMIDKKMMKYHNKGAMGSLYQWNTTEPSIPMAEALYKEAKERVDKLKKENTESKKENTYTNTTIINTNDIKPTITRLKAGLVALGFTELEAKEIIISKFI